MGASLLLENNVFILSEKNKKRNVCSHKCNAMKNIWANFMRQYFPFPKYYLISNVSIHPGHCLFTHAEHTARKSRLTPFQD